MIDSENKGRSAAGWAVWALAVSGLLVILAACARQDAQVEATSQPLPSTESVAEISAEIDPDSELAKAFTAEPQLAPKRSIRKVSDDEEVVTEASEKAKLPPGEIKDGIRHLTFADITDYKVLMPNPFIEEEEQNIPPLDDQVPTGIKALNGQTARIEGYVFPIEVRDGKAVTYLLMKSALACCFAEIPGINEWIYVEHVGGAPFSQTATTIVTGPLEVGAKDVADGAATTLYRMTGQKAELRQLTEEEIARDEAARASVVHGQPPVPKEDGVGE
jgi:hypothetical protein